MAKLIPILDENGKYIDTVDLDAAKPVCERSSFNGELEEEIVLWRTNDGKYVSCITRSVFENSATTYQLHSAAEAVELHVLLGARPPDKLLIDAKREVVRAATTPVEAAAGEAAAVNSAPASERPPSVAGRGRPAGPTGTEPATEALPSEEAVAVSPDATAAHQVESDGPLVPDCFVQGGKHAKLSKRGFQLVEFLWRHDRRVAAARSVCMELWANEEAESTALRPLIHRVNGRFLERDIPVTISIANGYVQLAIDG